MSENAAKSYFQPGREHPFVLCNSWVDHKKVKIANVYGTLPLTHSNSLIYRYKNHYFFLFPEARLSCWGNFSRITNIQGQIFKVASLQPPKLEQQTCARDSAFFPHTAPSTPPALNQNVFEQVPKERFEFQTLPLICMQIDI